MPGKTSKNGKTMCETISGNLLKIFNHGVLVLGKSGVGKSSLALQLIDRGHQLIADDIVILQKTQEGKVIGSCPPEIKDYLEIRGFGIVNCKEIFGPQALLPEIPIDLVLALQPKPELPSTSDQRSVHPALLTYSLLGMSIRLLNLPYHPTYNVALLVECAVKSCFNENILLKQSTKLDNIKQGLSCDF